jgi:hypothetical protein
LRESRGWLEKQKAKVLRVQPPARVKGAPALEHFALDVELSKEQFWMDYYVTRQSLGGATLAARLPRREAAALRKDVAALARSVVITRRLTAGK